MAPSDDRLDITVISKNGNNDVAAVIIIAVYACFVWYIIHPNEVQEWKAKANGFIDRALHNISILRARRAIRSLPETSE